MAWAKAGNLVWHWMSGTDTKEKSFVHYGMLENGEIPSAIQKEERSWERASPKERKWVKKGVEGRGVIGKKKETVSK